VFQIPLLTTYRDLWLKLAQGANPQGLPCGLRFEPSFKKHLSVMGFEMFFSKQF